MRHGGAMLAIDSTIKILAMNLATDSNVGSISPQHTNLDIKGTVTSLTTIL